MKILSRIQMLKNIIDKYETSNEYVEWDAPVDPNRLKKMSYKDAVDELRKVDTDIRGFKKHNNRIVMFDKNKNVITRYSSLYMNPDK